MSISIIILSAGVGSRLNSNIPKVFHKIGNHPLLYHVLDTANLIKPEKIILVISEKLKDYEIEIKKKFNNTQFCIQKHQLGTAHAVKSALNFLGNKPADKTLILYGDTPLIQKNTLNKLIRKFEKDKSDMCLLCMRPKDPKHYGRIILNKKNVKKIVEFTEASENEKKIGLCNSGIMIIKTTYLKSFLKLINNKNKKKEFYLTDLIEILNNKQKKITFDICNYNETLGVNDRSDLEDVEKSFQNMKKNYFLKKGITILDKNSVYFSFDTKIGKDSIIFPNVYFGPGVDIGENVKLKSFSHIEGAKIKNQSEIGPFARIRPKTIIEERARIGNFVEIKKSKIHKDVKISHLSYIGDALVGKNSNVGAGCITCNFDGLNKNPTFIGDNCFIGSNTSLIAPVSIGDNAVIGAGTVLKENVPPKTTIFRKSMVIKKKNKNN